MAVAFTQGENTIEIGVSHEDIGIEQTIVVPGTDTSLMVSNISQGTVFVSDTAETGKLGTPIVQDYVVVIANPGTLYLTPYGAGTIYITPGAVA